MINLDNTKIIIEVANDFCFNSNQVTLDEGSILDMLDKIDSELFQIIFVHPFLDRFDEFSWLWIVKRPNGKSLPENQGGGKWRVFGTFGS